MTTIKQKSAFSFHLITASCFLAALIFLCWKAPYGAVQTDESFYLTLPYRLFQGDAMIAQEWNPAQFFAILLYPAFSLAVKLLGGTEGIYLCFRYVFVAAQFCTALYLYLRLRSFSPAAALPAAMALLLYAPLHIMAISYNTLCIMLLAAACATMLAPKREKSASIVAGLLFAGAVLCCPFLVLIYLVYSLCCLIKPLCKRLPYSAFSPGFWLGFTAGCALLAAIFMLFLLSRATPAQLLAALPQLLNDSEHGGLSLGHILLKYFESIYGNFWFAGYSLSIPVLALIMALDKKRLEHRVFYIIPAMLITAGYFAYYILCSKVVNYLMFPLNILGGAACFLCRERDMRPFVFLYIPGLLYSFCIHLASNLAFISISSAMCISTVASVLYILRLAGELFSAEGKGFSRLVAAGLLLAVLMQLGVLCWFRGRYTMWDADTGSLDTRISAGPQKGVITTADYADRYYRILDDSAAVRDAQVAYGLYVTEKSWLYLTDDARMAAFSSWISSMRTLSDFARLEQYWQMHPDRVPQAVFVDNDGVTVEQNPRLLEKLEALMAILPPGFSVETTDSGFVLLPQK